VLRQVKVKEVEAELPLDKITPNHIFGTWKRGLSIGSDITRLNNALPRRQLVAENV
jgi:hypothetical protein